MKPAVPRLHVVTTRAILESDSFLPVARELMTIAGLALHLRGGNLPGLRLFQIGEQVGVKRDALLFINGRADIARALEADGVHLPEHGIPPPNAASLVGEHTLVGVSAHERAAVRAVAAPHLDYLFLGPIWTTSSHPDRAALGPAAIPASSVPVIAIGGVDEGRTLEATEHGAYGVAAVSAVWEATDPPAIAQRLLLLLDRNVA